LKVIVGIGNPGRQYLNTRHNIGFQILDRFCEKYDLTFKPSKGDFWQVESSLDTFHFFLVKPTTYVNRSGVVVKDLLNNLKLNYEDLLVVTDDTNLETGALRIRKSGSDGGHNGLKSIIYYLESEDFSRFRVGVGIPKNDEDLADYVLSEFSKDGQEKITETIPLTIELIEKFIIGGIDTMLDHFSRKMANNSLTN